MSVGYDGAHTAKETTDFNALNRIKNDVMCVLENFVHYNTPTSVYKTSTTFNKWTKKEDNHELFWIR